jgi:hypothetical protein
VSREPYAWRFLSLPPFRKSSLIERSSSAIGFSNVESLRSATEAEEAEDVWLANSYSPAFVTSWISAE